MRANTPMPDNLHPARHPLPTYARRLQREIAGHLRGLRCDYGCLWADGHRTPSRAVADRRGNYCLPGFSCWRKSLLDRWGWIRGRNYLRRAVESALGFGILLTTPRISSRCLRSPGILILLRALNAGRGPLLFFSSGGLLLSVAFLIETAGHRLRSFRRAPYRSSLQAGGSRGSWLHAKLHIWREWLALRSHLPRPVAGGSDFRISGSGPLPTPVNIPPGDQPRDGLASVEAIAAVGATSLPAVGHRRDRSGNALLGPAAGARSFSFW